MEYNIFTDLENARQNSTRRKRTYAEIMEALIDQMENNLTSKQICVKYDITMQTYYKWKNKYTKYVQDYIKLKNEDNKEEDEEDLNTHIRKCAARLKHLRKQLNLSQHNISMILNISQSTYNNIESGKLTLNSTMLRQLYKVLGFNPLYIITGESDCFLIKDLDLLKRVTQIKEKYKPLKTTSDTQDNSDSNKI